MLNLNNRMTAMKKAVLVRVVQLQLDGTLAEKIDTIPAELVPDDAVPVRGDIAADRAVIRARIVADLGISAETMDETTPLSAYVQEAFAREKPDFPFMTMLADSCHGCKSAHFYVTNLCQACEARPCTVNCPKKAIEFVNNRAHIDLEKCIGCGLCHQNCPYHVIVGFAPPCENACPVNAITKDEQGIEHIDYEKCVFCGACMRECPFGAMQAKSQLTDVIRRIQEGKKVNAMYAPAVAAQFRALSGQLDSALLKAGFTKAWEVATGADITADREAKEFEERMEEGAKLMTTSCCPAWVRLAQIHLPDIVPAISSTRSPMHYTGALAKKADPECVTVFIGPCMAKRNEGFNDECIDYVLTVDEIDALFTAMTIDITKMDSKVKTYLPTMSGRNFAKTGGVAESVRLRIKENTVLKPYVINGMTKPAFRQLQSWGKMVAGAVPFAPDAPNLVEVMCCEGGCIAGPGVILNPKLGNGLLTNYVDNGSAPDENGKPIPCDADRVVRGKINL